MTWALVSREKMVMWPTEGTVSLIYKYRRNQGLGNVSTSMMKVEDCYARMIDKLCQHLDM